MTDNYRYWLNFYAKYEDPDTGYYEFFPLNNNLKYNYISNEKFTAIIDSRLEGDFIIAGTFFDMIIGFNADPIYDLFLVELIISGPTGLDDIKLQRYITEFADYDYNQSKVKCKSFNNDRINNSFLNYLEKKALVSYGSLNIFKLGYDITHKAHALGTFIEGLFSTMLIYETFDKDNAWYGIESFDLDELRICSMRYILTDGVSAELGGGVHETNLEKIFKWIETLFRGYVWTDDSVVQFKSVIELVTNVLNIETLTPNMRQEQYKDSALYKRQVININENNIINNDSDWTENELIYTRGSDKKDYDLGEITTNYIPSTELNNSGIFLGYVVKSTGALQDATGYASGTLQANGYLSPANILDNYYRNFIFSKKANYSIAGNSADTRPSYYDNFVTMPDIKIKLTDPFVFYSGLRWRYDSVNNYSQIARVIEQSFNFADGLTTFKSYEFYNNYE